MNELLMLKGARKLLSVCTDTQPGEQVVIVTDPETERLARPLTIAAAELGAEPVVCMMPTRKVHGEEPPPAIAAALLKADVFFVPVKISMTHTQAIKKAVQNGARGLVMTDFSAEMMAGGGIDADFPAQAIVCQKIAAVFEHGNKVHLTTAAGTDLYLDATGRRGNALTGIVKRGEFSTIPTIEANFSPLEGNATGMIVADASIPYLGIGLLDEPVRLKVENGFITEITGGVQADSLRRNLEEQNDPNVYNIAELGVGLNPQARLCGRMLEDEGVLGVVHIGIGTNITLGGNLKAKIHYDVLMHRATLTVDDQIILHDGQIENE